MNKVLIINLAGRAFNIEEAGYDALRAYLDNAKRSLEGNPDQAEILADIESALAEKCATHLSANKNVVTVAEAETIIEEMGPVSNGEAQSNARSQAAPKRLYRIREGEMIFGVCNGLAAYFDIDVTLVRVVFVLLAVFTSGGFCLAYFLMGIFIPVATTPQERAESIGGIPTAQEVIETVKNAYETGSKEWRKWKEHSHDEHRRWKEERRKQWRYQQQWYLQRSPFWEFMNSLLGLVWFVLILWLGWWSYNHVPIARALFNDVPGWWHQLLHWISQKM